MLSSVRTSIKNIKGSDVILPRGTIAGQTEIKKKCVNVHLNIEILSR